MRELPPAGPANVSLVEECRAGRGTACAPAAAAATSHTGKKIKSTSLKARLAARAKRSPLTERTNLPGTVGTGGKARQVGTTKGTPSMGQMWRSWKPTKKRLISLPRRTHAVAPRTVWSHPPPPPPPPPPPGTRESSLVGTRPHPQLSRRPSSIPPGLPAQIEHSNRSPY